MTADRKWMMLSFASTLIPFVFVVASVVYLVYNQSVTRGILKSWIIRDEELHRAESAERRLILEELRKIAGCKESRRPGGGG